MSKRFKPQDYSCYKKLGIRWRKPKGHQSKLRVKKGGSGLLVKIGYGTKKELKKNTPVIEGLGHMDSIKGAALIASGIGAKETLKIVEEAKKLGIKILNMKKVRRAEKIAKSIDAKRSKIGKKEAQKVETKKEEIKAAESKAEEKRESR